MSEEIKRKVLKEMYAAWSRKEPYAISASHICDLTAEELEEILFTAKSKAQAIKDASKLENLSDKEVGKRINLIIKVKTITATPKSCPGK